jgi:DNA adenine methylase
MRYLGGKTRIAKQIAEQINRVRKPGQWVWEPFCGGLSVTVALSKAGPVWATDANPALISLYQAVRNGWQPPTEVSKEEWQAAKALPDSNPLKAFAGFGCSFGGMWFGSYAANQPIIRANGESAGYLTPAKSTAKLVLKNAPQAAAFAHVNFLSVEPRETQALLYCDPPYAGTAPYKGVAPFDSAKFCLRVAEWSRFTDVFVSEYQFPLGVCVWERTMKKNCARFANPTATERLYYVQRGSL